MVLAWLAALFAVMAAMLTLTALLVGWPILLLAIPLAGVAYLFWYHATGRLVERLRQQARGSGARDTVGGRRRRRAAAAGFGAEADPEWRGARANGAGGAGSAARGGFGSRASADGRGGSGRWSQRAGTPPTGRGMSPDRARGVLGVRVDADPEAVREAYREKVKEAHPDRGGSTEAFKRVNEAYETLDGAA